MGTISPDKQLIEDLRQRGEQSRRQERDSERRYPGESRVRNDDPTR